MKVVQLVPLIFPPWCLLREVGGFNIQRVGGFNLQRRVLFFFFILEEYPEPPGNQRFRSVVIRIRIFIILFFASCVGTTKK